MPVKRVAVIAYHSSPLREPGIGDSGGMTVFVRALAAAMAEQSVATDIFTRDDGTQQSVTVLSPRVRVVSMGAGPRSALPKEELPAYVGDFVAGMRSFAIANRIAYDVIHSHYWQSGMAGLELSAAWGLPWVHSNHTLAKVKARLDGGLEPESPLRVLGESKIMSAADVLVASTDEEYEQLACLYGVHHDRLKTIHPGVDHRVFRPVDGRGARTALGLDGRPTILYVGRIQRLKGLELAIRAIAELRPQPLTPTLVLVGGPSGAGGADEIRRLDFLARDLGVDDAVRFVGPRPHTELPQIYSAADVVAVCSFTESFGLSALEAQASGVPVVATAVGGLSHIVRDGLSGFLVGERDPVQFASKLQEVLRDRNLRESFGSAATTFARSFSWEKTGHEFLDLYECLVSERMPEACVC